MAKSEIPANKDVLTWAREVRGFTRQQTALKLKISEHELAEIEEGRQLPTTTIFNRMIVVYKQTESTLLLAQPPSTPSLPEDYRTAAGRRATLSPETRLVIRDVQELQQYVSELVEDDPKLIERAQLPVFTLKDNPEEKATQERARIGVALSVQLNWSLTESFDKWRDQLGRRGMLLLLKAMPWDDCRGFSLLDHTLLPTIVVNAEDKPTARVFTLFHEYAHLSLRSAGICRLTLMDSSVERWCNLFAAAFLLPAKELREQALHLSPEAGPTYEWPMSRISRLANYYRVSRAVVALRLQTLHLTTPNYFDQHKAELTSFDRQPKPDKPLKIKRKPGWREKQRLKEVGLAAASVIVGAWREQIVEATEAADVLNLSLDELRGLQEQTEVQRLRNVS